MIHGTDCTVSRNVAVSVETAAGRVTLRVAIPGGLAIPLPPNDARRLGRALVAAAADAALPPG